VSYIVLVSRGEAEGKVFEDTQKRQKPIVYIYGSRPFTAALCLGVETGMKGMKAGDIFFRGHVEAHLRYTSQLLIEWYGVGGVCVSNEPQVYS